PQASPDAMRHLDPRGLPRVGAVVCRGDVLVGKVAPQALSELTWDQKLLHAIYGRAGEEVADEALVYPHLDPGTVTAVRLWARSRRHCPRCGDVVCWSDACPHCRGPIGERQRDDLPPDCDVCVEVDVVVRRELRVGDVLRDDAGRC